MNEETETYYITVLSSHDNCGSDVIVQDGHWLIIRLDVEELD